MGDMLADSMPFFNSVFKSHVSQSVTYSRGVDSVTISATLGRTDFGLDDSDPMLETWNGKDFIFPAADLVLNSIQVEPARGDKIRIANGSETEIYTVMCPGSIPVFRPSGQGHSRLRVHAKQTGTE